MKEITLTRGKVAIVDDEDYEWLSQWKWMCLNNGYVVRTVRCDDGKRRAVLMHRLILDAPDGMDSDHINHNKLDNRRSNLRTCTTSQNTANSRMRSDNKSGIKGVYWHKVTQKWAATIEINGNSCHLGLYNDKDEAAQAYREKANELFGEYACMEIADKLEKGKQVQSE